MKQNERQFTHNVWEMLDLPVNDISRFQLFSSKSKRVLYSNIGLAKKFTQEVP